MNIQWSKLPVHVLFRKTVMQVTGLYINEFRNFLEYQNVIICSCKNLGNKDDPKLGQTKYVDGKKMKDAGFSE